MKTNNETEENNQYKQVYKSNNEIPFEVWFAPRDAEIAWPFVAEAPDPSLKSPKYDWHTYRWYENNEASQGQQLEQLSQTIEAVKKVADDSKTSAESVEKGLGAINQQLGTITAVLTQVATTKAVPDNADKAKDGDK